MKNNFYKKMIAIFAFLLFLINLGFSDVKIDRIALIDIDRVIEEVFSGNSAGIQKINQEKQDMLTKLKAIKDNIMKYQELELKTNDSSKKLTYAKKINELKKQYADYYKLRKYQIDQKIQNIQGPLLKEIYSVVKKIAAKDGYTLVLSSKTDGIFFYTIDIDITNEVIKYFSDRYGKKDEENN